MTRIETMLGNVSDNFDKSSGSFAYDVVKSAAIEMDSLEIKIASILEKLDVEKLSGDELTKFVFQRTGITRKNAAFSSTFVTIYGAIGAVINAGDLVAAEDVFYKVLTTSMVSASGYVYVEVECLTSGVIGNVPANTIISFPTTLTNITSVTNPSAVVNGYEAETDNDLRQRYYDKLQRPGKAGNKYHYEEWAESVVGVGKAKVVPRWNGPLTVKVVIVDANGNAAPQTLIDDVFTYIESERPFGANVTVESALELIVNISATITIEFGYVMGDVIQAIKVRIGDYFKEIGFTQGLMYISNAQVGREILDVPGVVDYANLNLNGTTGNLPIGELQIPVVGSVINV